MKKEDLQAAYSVFNVRGEGIESLLWGDENDFICERIIGIPDKPLSKVQLNQLFGYVREMAVSDEFFRFYWCNGGRSPYLVSALPGYSNSYGEHQDIRSVEQLFHGFYRIFIDGLLLCGNVRAYFRRACSLSAYQIQDHLNSLIFDTEAIKARGPALEMREISKDDRYLISEMACKSYGDIPENGQLLNYMREVWGAHAKKQGGAISITQLLADEQEPRQQMFKFSADDILDQSVNSEEELVRKYSQVADKFRRAREAALQNTKHYLSLVNDLDVYVATSMRTRSDFRQMADKCESIFGDVKVEDLHLRYFDPTMSAAEGHQDKGLIECLMVRCSKVLIYCAGEKESYGKDAEAAMALSLGKNVIFLCDNVTRNNFYKEVHPLSRLINFSTGVAVGAIVTTSPEDVALLLDRIFENEMHYELRQHDSRTGYLQLLEAKTGSIIRIQTDDKMLSEAFWNHYKRI